MELVGPEDFESYGEGSDFDEYGILRAEKGS